jgi:hypothetical protein
MNNLDRGSSKDASYQVSIHLDKQFQRGRFLKNRPFRNKNCLWWPSFLMDWEEMSNLYIRELSIDASYQVSVHLSKPFRGEDFLEINQTETRIVCAGHVC